MGVGSENPTLGGMGVVGFGARPFRPPLLGELFLVSFDTLECLLIQLFKQVEFWLDTNNRFFPGPRM